jgi:predicted pyridoxine 5'-phosphate oxidase superfamily flavin-nucleotide-binding protein
MLEGVPKRIIADASSLRGTVGSPTELTLTKMSDRLNSLTRQFIERSPFVCVATASPEGGLDVSPRGRSSGVRAGPG